LHRADVSVDRALALPTSADGDSRTAHDTRRLPKE
jgi:hypothetical protein